MLLENKVAFVTAAGSGIGAMGAIRMAREGARVVVTDRDGAAAERVVAAIAREGNRAEALCVDVTDDAALEGAIARTAATHGRLDVLHSHAGIQIEGKLEQVTAADMD
ncbi:MAG: SDR family NAD(P)-dependent oxidoreductase, partial [Pseudomonadota bacterium]